MNPWLIFAVITVVLVVGGPTSCVIHSNQMIANMVEAGASPTEAQCAMKSEPKDAGIACLTAALLRSIEGAKK